MPYPAANPQGCTIILQATVKPDKLDEFLELFHKLVDDVKSEPECLTFEVFRYPDEPNHLKWVESWTKSPEWIAEVHVNRPYMKEFSDKLGPLLAKERTWEIVERFGGLWAHAKPGVYQPS